MWARRKKLSLSIIVLSLLSTSLGLFTAPVANAVVAPINGGGSLVYTWVDVSTIQYGTQKFVANDVDARGDTNDFDVYTLQNDPDGCSDTIQLNRDSQSVRTDRVTHLTNASNNFFVDNGANDQDDKIQFPNEPETVTLNTKVHGVPSLTSNSTACVSKASRVDVLSGSLFAITMKENTDGTISMLGSSRSGGYKFTLDTTANTFIRNVTDNCKDTLDVTQGSNTAKLTVRVQQHAATPTSYGKEGYLTSDYRHYPFVHQLDYDSDGPNHVCWVAQVATITLASPYITPANGGISTTNNGTSTSTGTPVGGSGGSTADQEAACAGASGPYAWILCPAVTKADDMLKKAYINLVEPLLNIDPLNTSSDNGTYIVWKSFVSLANVLFVLAFIGIIFGTVLNLDAYTVKKALPRLVIAAVLVQLSYFLCGVLIDISNIFGDGLLKFITHAVTLVDDAGHKVAGSNAIESGLSYGTTALVVGGFVYAAFLGPAVVLFILGLVLAVFTFVITLLVRKVLITTLVILAPIAFVAWILPNTDSLFKKWKDNFLKMLFIYPIMSILIGSSYVIQAASQGGGKSAIGQIIGGVAPMIAFFMMPAVFKMSGTALGMAGGAVGKIGGWANKKGSARTEKAYDNSALLKNRAAKKTANNIRLANGTDGAGNAFTRRNAQRKLGFGFAQTNGSRKQISALQDKQDAEKLAAASRTALDTNVGDLATSFSDNKSSEATQIAAVSRAAQSNTPEGADALEKMWAASDGNPAKRAAIKKAIDKNPAVRAAVQARAPHMLSENPDNDAAESETYSRITAENLSTLSPESLAKFTIAARAAPVGSTMHTNAVAQLEKLNGSASAKGKLSTTSSAELKMLSNTLIPGNTHVF